MGSPRYIAAHMLMPRFVRERGVTTVLDAIARNDGDFFIPVWFEAGFRFNPLLIHTIQGDFALGILGLPQPREMTEAWLAVIVGKPADPSYCRYFLWEKSISVLDNTPRTVVGEWDESKHGNHGDGPAFTGDLATDCAAFVTAVMNVCTRT